MHLSDEGFARLNGLAHVVRRLRRLTGLPLVDLLDEAETAIGLDLEVLSRPEHTASSARVHLDAFADVAARYVTNSDRPTLSGFLSWLEAARSQERGLDAGQVESDTDAVQVLTVHAAKGLEWDVVAIPSLVEGLPRPHRHVGRADGAERLGERCPAGRVRVLRHPEGQGVAGRPRFPALRPTR